MMTDTAAFLTIVPGKLTVCTYGGFAPVCYKNAAGQLIGYDVSFLTRFAQQEGREIVLIEKEFEGLWTLPNERECVRCRGGGHHDGTYQAARGERRLERSILSS